MSVICYSDTGEVLSRMTTGDFFGEIGILNLDGGVNRYSSAVLLDVARDAATRPGTHTFYSLCISC